MKSYHNKQVKLSSGEEFICEVIEYASPETDNCLIIKNAMSITSEFSQATDKYYMFVPFFHYVESDNHLSLLNRDHILAITTPDNALIEQYQLAINEMHLKGVWRETERNIKNSTDLKRFLDSFLEESSSDSATSNIIPFPTFH